jgi:hypothetical protein
MPLGELAFGRERLWFAGGSPEPVVSIEKLVKAISPNEVESLRPLLPVGYDAGVKAYQLAAQELTARDLADHYTHGLTFFHENFVPHLKQTLEYLSGNSWCLDDYVAYAGGSDVDFMTHLIEAIAAHSQVCLFPGDWFGFLVGCTQRDNINWDAESGGELGCLCIPSVRNGHFTERMLDFLASSRSCLLNLNLYPTLVSNERFDIGRRLSAVLDRSILSISFSRGFGLTASQLGVILIHRERFHDQWTWFTHFYNALAARAFMLLDLSRIQAADEQRRAWVNEWLEMRHLPAVRSGSYYVKSFQTSEEVPHYLMPLCRDGLMRLCLKPPVSFAAGMNT